MARSKVRKIEVRKVGEKVKVTVYGEGQRGAQYVLKSMDATPEDLATKVRAPDFWDGTGVRFDIT